MPYNHKRLFNKEKNYIGIGRELKKLEVTENCLNNNTKVVLTTPQLVVGELPVKGKQPPAEWDIDE